VQNKKNIIRYRRGELVYEILEGLLGGAMLAMMIVAALSGGAVGFRHRWRKEGGWRDYQKEINEKSLYETLRRLKQQGMVIKKRNHWAITMKGREYLQKAKTKGEVWHFMKYPKEKSDSQIIFIFDIPERLRASRTKVRAALLALDFSMLQKSVWIGETNIPSEFLRDLKDWGVIRYVHIFTVGRRGTLKDKKEK